MESALNTPQPEQFSYEHAGEKSELMKVFEAQVHDLYWAYKDLLKAIAESDDAQA